MAPNKSGKQNLPEGEVMIKSSDDNYKPTIVYNSSNCQEFSKFTIYKNLLLICFAFTLNFTAFGGVSNLQSSLNYKDGLGTGCMAVIYGALILSAMFAPTFCIKKFGCKWTICFSIVGYVSYSLANFYPSWLTLVPACILVGMSAAPLWAAKCTYLTTIATRYSKANNVPTDGVVNFFFGIFFFFFQLNSIFGSLISSFIISTADDKSLNFPTCYNESYIDNYCGANDELEDFKEARLNYNSTECPVTNLQSKPLPKHTLFLLMGIYAVVGLSGAALVGFCVDKIELSDEEDKNKNREIFDLTVATFMHMKDKRQLLLIPITMYSGFEQAFIWSDYTRSYVTCPLAVKWVGIVIICFGVFDASCSCLFGKIEKWTGRMPLFILATTINISLAVVMLNWTPYPNNPFPFFAIPAGWGIADAVWQTQLNAFYGVLFLDNKEAAFSNYRLWESLGFVIAFAYQGFVKVSYKLYVLLGLLPVGMALYFVVEHIERKRKKGGVDYGNESQQKLDMSTDYYSGSSTEIKKDKFSTSI